MHPLVSHLLRVVGYGVGTLLGLVMLAAAALWLLMPAELCGNSVVSEQVSPDGKRKLVVFSRDCGATTDFSTHASLLDVSDALPNEAGNVFAADRDHGSAPAGAGGGPRVNARWLGNNRLVLVHHAGVRVFNAMRSLDGIEIEYDSLH